MIRRILVGLSLLAGCGGGGDEAPIEVGGVCYPIGEDAAGRIVDTERAQGALGVAAIHSDTLLCADGDFGGRVACELPSGGRVGIRTPRDLGGFENPTGETVAAIFYGARVICSPLRTEQ